MSPSLLYVTSDGLLESLGFSQVVRVVEALAAKGWRYQVLSLEKPADLKRADRVRDVERRLSDAGIRWHRQPYDWSGSARAAVANLKTLISQTLRLVATGKVDAVHARAYHGVFAAHAAWLGYRTPYLFDTRSYWFDERLEEGRWFTTPIRLGVARGFEHQFFAHAAAVVSLTELQADDVRQGRFGPAHDRPIVCIPTCADYEDFVRRPVADCTRVPEAVRAKLSGACVLGIVGSLNRSYLVDETLDLARRVLERRPDAQLLVLTGQIDAYRERLGQHGLGSHPRVTVTKADHDAMPEWLSLMTWGMLLLDPQSPAKRASMPTKLAEFFATGVRPVQFGCNSEVSEWVKRAGSGLVLPGIEPHHLDAAAQAMASSTVTAQVLAEARALTTGHFSLASGVARYDAVLRRAFEKREPFQGV